MNYVVVSNTDINEFLKEVRGMLQDGWTPQGGICVTRDITVNENGFTHVHIFYFQALVRQN